MMETVLQMENITKVYSNGFIANDRVNFSLREGEIHALVGENGAGKSTLMKILFGIETPEEGRILLRGEEIKIDSPLTAIKYGIGMVHQHFMLVPTLTVAENMVLGMEPTKQGILSMQKAIQITKEVSEKYNLEVDPIAKVEDLPVGTKQKVEILKALLRGAKILILDEPTAVLTPQETRELFVQLKNLKNMGHTIVFISHKLQEIMELCDRITVLRLGRYIGTEDVVNVTETILSRMMVGRDVILTIEKDRPKTGKTVLKVRNIKVKLNADKYLINDVSFSVRAGEILGIAGVEGNGQSELSQIITGLTKNYEGEVTISGEGIRNKSVRNIRDLKVSHISEDRMTYGAVSEASIYENIISDRFHKKEYNKGLLQNRSKLHNMVNKLIKDYFVKCDSSSLPIKMLSGGNIQKVVIARELSSGPELIIANQPTRGIDVGSSEFIRNKLVSLRDNGAAILLISADLNEVLEVSDSIIVMSGGKISAYLPNNKDITEDELGEYMLGIKQMSQEEIKEVEYA